MIEDFDPTLKEFDRLAALFASQIKAHDFAADTSRVEPYRDCTDCNYRAVCRTAYTSSGRSIPAAPGQEH